MAKGANFRIFLPRAAGDACPEEHPALPESLTGDETALLVEDEIDVRNFAREVLLDHGYRVIEASDGSAAIEVAGKFQGRIHLLLTDVVMPGMNGTELPRRLTTARPIRRCSICPATPRT